MAIKFDGYEGLNLDCKGSENITLKTMSRADAVEILEELQCEFIKQNYEECDIAGYVAIGVGLDAIKKEWISTKDKLPESGQEILTCYYDEATERHEIGILTYFKMGAVMYTEIDRATDPKKHLKTWLTNVLYNADFQIKAGEDGFYIYEWNEVGDTCCRKHADVITHWMPLPKPPNFV